MARLHLVRGKTGFRIEESDDKEALVEKLKAAREAVAHSFGPKMTKEEAEAKAAVLNTKVDSK